MKITNNELKAIQKYLCTKKRSFEIELVNEDLSNDLQRGYNEKKYFYNIIYNKNNKIIATGYFQNIWIKGNFVALVFCPV